MREISRVRKKPVSEDVSRENMDVESEVPIEIYDCFLLLLYFTLMRAERLAFELNFDDIFKEQIFIFDSYFQEYELFLFM